MSQNSYNWMSASVRKDWAAYPDPTKLDSFLASLDKMASTAVWKNLYAAYAMSPAKKNKSMLKDNIQSYKKSSAFRSFADEYLKGLVGQFRMSGLVCIMAGTVVMMFIGEIIHQEYMINFSVDAIAAVIALVFLYSNLKSQISLVKQFGKGTSYIVMDVLAFLAALIFKLTLPAAFDVSLIIFLIAYFFERSRFKKDIASVENELNN